MNKCQHNYHILFQTIYGSNIKCYTFYPSIDSNTNDTLVDISLLSYSGNIDIFISSIYKHPNYTNFDHSLQLNLNDLMKSQSLTIDVINNDNPICNITFNQCRPIYISVETNISSLSTYNIMVTQNIIGILSDGITIQSMLSSLSAVKLFRFTIDKTSIHSLMITVSSLSPNPNILIIIYPSGNINNVQGNITQTMYISSETLTIQDGDNNFCLSSDIVPCIFFASSIFNI